MRVAGHGGSAPISLVPAISRSGRYIWSSPPEANAEIWKKVLRTLQCICEWVSSPTFGRLLGVRLN